MIRYFRDLVQGSDEWTEARCGLLTASEMHLILTPTLKVAANENTRAHVYELLAQRINRYVEPTYIGDDMLRGIDDEFYALEIYREHIAPVEEVGFVTNDRWGFTIGYSPDGLVGGDGLIEIKSRRQRFQVQTIIEGAMPADFVLQVQTGLLVTERKWLDFVSYCGGMPMAVIRIHPIREVQDAIVEAASDFEAAVAAKLDAYRAAPCFTTRIIPTERRIVEDMYV